ncbi:adenylate/guanylate cyclase domain-containing protein [Sulfitobacter sp. JL08]|uniref:adenylate/guanylate cyclase domain-containing protein n=1 Tax=Sulfitobacter sp. JL08 TaxID=2070369 RepID=UPI000E0A0030|nr:adenylate/guanylate cyclase domain-containing protein [Sulfitobacter sp. JL08]AXI55487.1 adenylate/guanylate cyclase domain-containing protein [Sulfitobacter sp. JL08]
MERRLAAIFMADAVSSTAAMEQDEERAVIDIASRLKAIKTAVESNKGRVFNKAGDSILAEFSSPRNAMLAALESRARLAAQGDVNAMRYGLHLADVIVDGEDLLGDGVNLTARIQSDAAPGDILVSDAFFSQVRRASPCKFDPPVQRQFKGISDPITVYRVRERMGAHLYQSDAARPDVTAKRRPNSVAVVPFRTSSSADEDQTFLADGLAEDLILELSRVQGLFVVSRTAANELRYRDPVEIGRKAGVGFVLTGSVRKLGNRIRFSVSLYNGDTGAVVWSDRIQRDFLELLDMLDDVVVRVASTVFGRIEQAEIQAAKLKRPESMTAYEYYLRGMDLHRMGGVTIENYREAVEWFDRAIAEDKSFSRGYSMKVCSASNLDDFDFDTGQRMIETALRLDPEDADAHRIMGNMQLRMHRDFDKAQIHYERAMELAPNNAHIIGLVAAFHIFNGDPEKGLELLERAETMDPFIPVWILENRIRAYFSMGKFDDMLAWASKLPFQTRCSRIYRAVVSMKHGDVERARQLIAATLADDPSLTSEFIRMQELYRDEKIMAEMLPLAESAGLPSPANASG